MLTYPIFLYRLHDLLHKHGFTKIEICAVSNLVYTKIDRVYKFCCKHNIQLDTSFDFVGRFTKQRQVDLWLSNMHHLYDRYGHKPEVSTVGSLSNIEYFKSSGSLFSIFKEFYNKGYVWKFEPYDDVTGADGMAITPHQWADFVLYLIQYYPKVYPAPSFIEKYSTRKLDISDSCDILSLDLLPHETWCGCCDKYPQHLKMIKEKGCFSCAYYPFCALPCPIDNVPNSDFCVNRHIFNGLSANGNNLSCSNPDFPREQTKR